MLGTCITTIHRIENYITESFIFAIGNKKYDNYKITEVTKFWKEKFTFGKLIQLIEERYEIEPTIRRALDLFLIQRNKIAHGLTKDERYDIDTLWGQKETISFLALFLRNAWELEKIFEASYVTTIGMAFYLMKKETKEIELLNTIEEFEKDPNMIEKMSLFTDAFKMKEQ